MVLTADKGVALVVMDKSQYIDKCMALLDDTKVYKLAIARHHQELNRDIQEALWQLNRDHGTTRLFTCNKHYYNKLLPTGNTSPALRFYGLPKIHKANCPVWPIVSACGTATYQLAKFLTKILQKYTGISPSLVKDSKWGLQKDLKIHTFPDGCKSSYVGETSCSLGDRAKEHAKPTMSAIHKHYWLPPSLALSHQFCHNRQGFLSGYSRGQRSHTYSKTGPRSQQKYW